jgi:hypothetical protein
MITWTHLRTLSISAYPYAAEADLHRLLQNPGRFPGGDADQPEEKKGWDHHKGGLAEWSFFEVRVGWLVHGRVVLDSFQVRRA